VSAGARVAVAGRELSLSNLDKVLYPETGTTKGEVIDYYRRVAPALLPHLQGRALTLKRYPNGVDGGHFYEKRCPSHRPRWVRVAPLGGDRFVGLEGGAEWTFERAGDGAAPVRSLAIGTGANRRVLVRE